MIEDKTHKVLTLIALLMITALLITLAIISLFSEQVEVVYTVMLYILAAVSVGMSILYVIVEFD